MKRVSLYGCLAVLAVCSLLGVLFVRAQQDSAALAEFSGRFLPMADVGFTGDGDCTLNEAGEQLTLRWRSGTEALAFSSAPIPLRNPGAKEVQVDLFIGGTMNASGAYRTGFRAYLEVTLYDGSAVGASARLELPLESWRERERLYSLCIPCEGAAHDALRLRLIVEPVDGQVGEGLLTCSYVEVIER